MAELDTRPVGIKDSPLPPMPDGDPTAALGPSQFETLVSVCDAVIPSIVPDTVASVDGSHAVTSSEYNIALKKLEAFALGGESKTLAKDFLAEKPSDLTAFRDNLARFLAFYFPNDQMWQLWLILSLIETRPGALFFTGYASPFSSQPIHVREAILKSWATARLPVLRMVKKTLTLLARQMWAKSSSNLDKILAFPRVPVHGKHGKGFEFEFIQIPPGDGPEIIETDVVIVGSGCGAGVCAKSLAEAGHKVIVAEKSYHWPAEHLPMTQGDAFVHMFMDGGAMLSDDNSTAVLAGSVWGGGGTINWSASLQTQGYVRKEWADQGLPFFTSAEYQACLDRVCHRMGVSADHIEHNKTNRVLLEGARKLGWAAKPVPQNTAGRRHYCGYCTLGCGACEKQGPVVSFLPDAARAGAHFIEGFDCRKVLFENQKGKQVAIGVQGKWKSRDEYGGVSTSWCTEREVIIKAKRVIVSCGTLQSPLVLLRSGLKNRNIGRNLHLHPVSMVGAIYDEETRPWEGGILTAVVNEFENLDGRGHGAKLEACTMLPSIWLPQPVWTGGLDFKLLAPRMKNMVGYISLARDRDPGQVYADSADGRARFTYCPSRFDKRSLLAGVVGLAKLTYVEGAREIFTTIPGLPHYVRSAEEDGPNDAGINHPRFQQWLVQIEKRGLPDPDCLFASAHQMGTCRMGASAKKGVVDSRGKVWGTEGLYVADASVFPSASGVNPMVTTMAISDWIAGCVGKDLRGVEERARL